MTGTRLLPAGCAGAMLAVVLATSGLAEEQASPRDNPGTDKGRFIDTHVHFFSVQKVAPGSNPSPGADNPLDKVAEWMKANRVRRCINLPLAQSRPRNEEDRRRMLENYAKYKGRIDRFCVVFPEEVSSVEEAVKILAREKQDGAIGFGEHYGVELKFDDPNNMRLYAACAKVALPVLFHMDRNKNLDEKGLPRLENVLKTYPDCVIIAHGDWWKHLADGTCDRLLKNYPNLHADISCTVARSMIGRDKQFARAFLIRNADKLLFGTDSGWWSLGKDKKPAPEFSLIGDLDLPAEVVDKICRGNAQRLFWPGGSETAAAATAPAAPAEPKEPAEPAYAVVVSRATRQDADWKPVVETLVQKHNAKVIEYDKQVAEALDALKEAFPRYTCFVAQPTEAGREFVAAVSDLARKLDEDPYTDTLWGILTGYTAPNALAIARHQQPLVIHKVAGGTRFAMGCCEQGIWYDELVKNKVVYKKPGGEPNELRGPDDTTAAIAKTLNEYHPDLFITSGHATERDWQIGFRYRNGQFRCAEGRLFGLDTGGARHPIDSNNPKVYMPVGNCLMGHIDRPDCMALAWMNSAGVMQMIGYTVPTGFGYAGWGCLNYFVEQPGRYTFTEAFFANQQALIHAMESGAADAQTRTRLKNESTVVAFYGDPAWQARMAAGKLAFEQSLAGADGRWTFEVKPKDANSFAPVDTNGSQRQPRPFLAFFDRRLKDIEVVEGADLKPVITDDFILVERPAACDPSKTYRVVFRATPIR